MSPAEPGGLETLQMSGDEIGGPGQTESMARPAAEAILLELEEFASSYESHTGLTMSPGLKDRLVQYVAELYKWNDRAALLSRKDESRVVERHVMDSLSLLAFVHETDDVSLLDIGSGAGFPAVPLKLAAPGLSVSMVESTHKKVLFLNYVIGKLGLKDIFALEDRMEKDPWRALNPDGYDIVTSRATFNLAELIPLAVPAVKRGGLLIAYKGGRYEDELAAAATALANTSLRLVTVWTSPWGPGRLMAFQRS
jgi:16S rRNA (guanine527-N7)-methyltransferase